MPDPVATLTTAAKDPSWPSKVHCDETGVGIARLADGAVTLLAGKVASSVGKHARFGGVVPNRFPCASQIAPRPRPYAGPWTRWGEPARRRRRHHRTRPGRRAAGRRHAAKAMPRPGILLYAVNLGGHLAADVDHGPLQMRRVAGVRRAHRVAACAR